MTCQPILLLCQKIRWIVFTGNWRVHDPRMTLAVTRYGGHCAFFDGPLARRSWAAGAIVEYLRTADRLLT